MFSVSWVAAEPFMPADGTIVLENLAFERTARHVISALIEKRLLVSGSHKAPLRLGFPIYVVERWFRELYPAT